MLASEGTFRAATDLGIDWVVSRSQTRESDVPTIEPVSPYDLQLPERGNTPAETFAQITRPLDDPALVLAHPNIHVYHDATEAFEAWLAKRSPVPPVAVLDKINKLGLLCDCFASFLLQ